MARLEGRRLILEFILASDENQVLTSIYNVQAVPRKGETVYLQTSKGELFIEYRVHRVDWQLDARGNFSAIAVVGEPSGFGE